MLIILERGVNSRARHSFFICCRVGRSVVLFAEKTALK